MTGTPKLLLALSLWYVTKMIAIFRKLHEIGFEGYVRSDHAPQLATDASESPEGYGMQGHLFALGYLRGLERATAPRSRR